MIQVNLFLGLFCLAIVGCSGDGRVHVGTFVVHVIVGPSVSVGGLGLSIASSGLGVAVGGGLSCSTCYLS